MPDRDQPRMAVLAGVSIGVGVVDGLIFLGFEWLINHGTQWIWNDVVQSDTARWRVVPLALVLSVALSWLLAGVGEARWVEPHLNPLAATGSSDGAGSPAPTLKPVAIVLLVGAASLLAGASLGPEAPLLAATTGLGGWAAARASLGSASPLVPASVGALLVAFFGSLFPLAIPLVIVYQRTRRVPVPAVTSVVLAGLAAFGTLLLVQGDDHGFGHIPSASVHLWDYLVAVVLGAIAVGVGALLRWSVRRLATVTRRFDRRRPWWLAAAVLGLGLGALYLLGGESVQFSGSTGVGLLARREMHDGAWALAGIALVKLVVTGWSVAAGYRGGLVFPSVFVGVAVSLCAEHALPHLAGPGVMLGCVAGLLVEMTSPVIGVVMLLALLPAKLLVLGLVSAAGAVLAHGAAGKLPTTR